jgi:hypothetical protein
MLSTWASGDDLEEPMPGQEKIYAVLTGDLVKSSKLSSEESHRAVGLLKSATRDFAEIHPGSLIGKVDTFRFDSWQLLLGRPGLAFHAAVFLRTVLKMESDFRSKLDTRVSIGIGPVEIINEQQVSNSRGPAFTASGKVLDSMGNRTLAFSAASEPESGWQGLKEGVAPLLDCVVKDWTSIESRAVHGAFWGWTQEEAASRWPRPAESEKPITRQAVSDSLIRAHWTTVEAVLSWTKGEIARLLKSA